MARKERMAKNEALFREVNERVREIQSGGQPEGVVEFLCECGNEDCTAALPLTAAEYEHVRSHSAQFVIVPAHDDPEVESVVGGVAGRFAIVRKHEDEEMIARATDPRA